MYVIPMQQKEFFNLILSNVDMFYCIDEIYLKKSF